MATIETLEIEIKKSSDDAVSGIDKLTQSLSDLKNVISGSLGLTSSINQIKKLKKSLDDMSGSFDGISNTFEALQAISKLDFSNLEQAAESMQRIGNRRFRTSTPVTTNAGNEVPTHEQVGEATGAVERENNVASRAADISKKLAGALGKVCVAFKDVAAAAVKGAAGIGKFLGKSFVNIAKSALKPVSTLKKSLGGLIKSIGRIALYRTVRSAIKWISESTKEGVQNLAQYSKALNGADASTANQTMSEYAATLQQVKNSIGAAVMPALTALLPIVNTIASAFITAANAVNQFLQALGGKSSYTKAVKNSTDYAKSLDGAAGSAKELQKTLLGFDEINRLNDDNSGGGGASGADYGNMFEEATVDTAIQSFAQKIKNALKTGEWDDVMNEVAGKVNELSAKMLSILDAPALQEKVAYLVTSFANGLNTLVSQIDWNQMGQVLGAGLDLAFTVMASFLYTFDWINLGSQIAELVNGAITEIDWENAGKILWSKFEIIFEMLAGFIQKLDMKEVAKAFSKLTISLANSISETIKKIDWQKIGNQIATLIREIDWSGIAESVAYLVGCAFGALLRLVQGTIEDAVNGMIDYFSEKIQDAGGSVAEGLWNGIIDGLGDISRWLDEHIVEPFVSGLKDLFGIHSPSTVLADIGENLIAGLLSGITSAWSTVTTWWDNTVGGWINKVSQTMSNIFSGGNTVTTTVRGTGFTKKSGFGSTALAKAGGGFVSSGELFVAREAGPELVGSIGGRTAVANNDQIVAAVSAGVAQAVASVMESQNNSGSIHVYLDSKEISAGLSRRNRMYGAVVAGV